MWRSLFSINFEDSSCDPQMRDSLPDFQGFIFCGCAYKVVEQISHLRDPLGFAHILKDKSNR